MKRLLLGRALRTEQAASGTVRRSLPAFSSDALSSNVYATQEILIVLAVGGTALYRYGWMVAACVAAVFLIVVTAYRSTLRHYPMGGGDYDVAKTNLGPWPAVTVASAMLIDFALTLAVSVAAILDVVVSVTPDSNSARLLIGLAVIALLALLTLRASPLVAIFLRFCSYVFVFAVVLMTVWGIVETVLGEAPRAASADWELADPQTLSGVALFIVLARAFSSGSVAVTGVEAVGTAVPAFQPPRGPNAAKALRTVALMWIVVFAGITWLTTVSGVQVTEDDAVLIGAGEQPQQTVLVQLADAVFGTPMAVFGIAAATVLVLAAAGVNSYRSFSVLTSVLARDEYLPRLYASRGDRLVYSNGIITLAIGAGLALWVFDTSLTTMIQLYVVGVFLALTVGQAGMVRHWTRIAGRAGISEPERSEARRARLIALVGQCVAGVVLVIVVVSKFLSGAWIVVLLIPLLAVMMRRVHGHYERVRYEVAASEAGPADASANVTALILVSRIHKPTLRALAYARATRPTAMEAVTVAVDEAEAEQLQAQWRESGIPVPLRVLPSPFREISSPVIAYVRQLSAAAPDGLLTVYVPEYVVTHWWEELLHNQSAARLKRRLMELPDVVVVTVPWQIWTPDGDVAAPAGANEKPAP